jgi:two-component system OmpR family response regulator
MALKRILIVDDEQRLARMMQLNLEACGRFEVLIENKGTRAVQVIRTFKPDFIFLDVKMPDMHGFDVMRYLKADPELSKIPTVFLTAALSREGPTGNPDSDDQMIGQYPYLVKPSSTEELIHCIDRHLPSS